MFMPLPGAYEQQTDRFSCVSICYQIHCFALHVASRLYFLTTTKGSEIKFFF